MTFKRTLTPATVALFVNNLDEQPSGKDTEIFDALDLGHGVDFCRKLRGDFGIRSCSLPQMIKRRCGLAGRQNEIGQK